MSATFKGKEKRNILCSIICFAKSVAGPALSLLHSVEQILKMSVL